MKLDAWRSAATGLVALLVACGPGDHARSAELNRFFGGGAAGAVMTGKAASTPTADAAPVVPIATNTPARNTNAGAKASVSQTPNAGASADAGAVSVGGAPATTIAGAAVKPVSSPAMSMAAAGTAGGTMMCPAGYLALGTACVCDLNGSFALHANIPVMSAAMAPLEALSGTMQVWGLLRQQLDASGVLSLSMSICGQTSPDICASAQPPVLSSNEAYGQYVPVEAWDRASETPATTQLSLSTPLPGAAFDTQTLAQLFGISLSDPLGAWPASFKDVQGTNAFDGSATNGAQWVDTDADGKSGITLRIVGAAGAASHGSTGPLQTYGSTSSECPRTNAQAARSPYAYLPLPQGLGVKRIKALYSAQRISFELHGTLDSCDQASGMLTGRDGGALAFDALVGGCSMVSGSGEADCTQAVVDAASGNGGVSGLKLGTGSFAWTRIAAEATCADVRAARESSK